MRILWADCRNSAPTSAVRIRRLLVALLAVAGTVPLAAVASEPSLPIVAESVVIKPAESFRIDGREYAGDVEVSMGANGLVIIETVDPDRYLYGIREMPASWEPEALKTQAVAARTYLAWTLARGRVGSGAKYGFDICATTQCQVYRGSGTADVDPRWRGAVDATIHEILLYGGSPAQALYSSTTGGRTRNIEDVWGGGAKPYLVAVASPGERSPFVDWSYSLTVDELNEILEAAGEPTGLVSMRVEITDDGAGPWQVIGLYPFGLYSWSTWEFRGIMNRWGPRVLPDDLPAYRTVDRRYPQVVLGPTYQVDATRFHASDARGYPGFTYELEFQGKGWGHLVGMSQYGAQQMASEGAGYDEILNHYYTGLWPELAGQHLPSKIRVGLTWDDAEVVLALGSNDRLEIDGEPVESVEGEWLVVFGEDGLELYPPGSAVLRDLATEPTRLQWWVITPPRELGPGPR
jgi:stage II sporulation protein D